MRRSNAGAPPPLLSPNPNPVDISISTDLSPPLSHTVHPAQARGRNSASNSNSTSPLSSTAGGLSSPGTSPSSSPTSPFLKIYRRLSSRSADRVEARSRSQSPFNLPAALRSRPSLILLRRRPSTVDLALDEERSRCDENSVEKQGLELLEPRPVGPVDIPMDLNASVSPSERADDNNNDNAGNEHNNSLLLSPSRQQQSQPQQQQPRFVMGGIAEVLEGRG